MPLIGGYMYTRTIRDGFDSAMIDYDSNGKSVVGFSCDLRDIPFTSSNGNFMDEDDTLARASSLSLPSRSPSCLVTVVSLTSLAATREMPIQALCHSGAPLLDSRAASAAEHLSLALALRLASSFGFSV